jgi:hypothetical protein
MAYDLGRRLGKLEAAHAGAANARTKTAQALTLEAQGYEAWLKTLASRTFTAPLAFFHHELWQWYWSVRLKILRDEPLSSDELSFLAVWFRGGGKSSNVEWACIAEGALVGDGFVMYVCDTEKQAKKHVQSIRDRLDSPEIVRYYPGLANPRVDRHGVQVGWRQDYLATASGWGIIPVGLDQGIRGGRQRDMRFSMIVLDDIDSHEDTPAAVEKKLELIARSILPAGTSDTLVLFPQNLIHENSVLSQILTRRSDVLSERSVSGPVKAFGELELELDESAEGRKWRIQSCVPTWAGLDVEDARKFLGKFGRKAFLSEYQHDFGAEREEKVLPHYNDTVHVITWEEFARMFGGARRIPERWNKYVFNDWARTKTAYHANVAGKVTVSSQNEPLPGFVFAYDMMSFDAGTLAETVALRLLKSISPTVDGTPSGRGWEDLMKSELSRAGLEGYVTDATELIRARREALARVFPRHVQPLLQRGNYRKFAMSHEADDVRSVYRQAFGLPFVGVNPGKSGGIEWLNHYMQVDAEARHPFRPEERGFTRFFLIVDDDRRAFPASPSPDDLHDSDLARYQFKHWRNSAPKLNELGVVERGPQKMNDDYANGLMFLFHDNGVQAAPLDAHEQRELRLAPELQRAAIAEITDSRTLEARIVARNMRLNEMKADAESANCMKRMSVPRVRFRR